MWSAQTVIPSLQMYPTDSRRRDGPGSHTSGRLIVRCLRLLSSFCLGETEVDCADLRIAAAAKRRRRRAYPAGQDAQWVLRAHARQAAHLPGGHQRISVAILVGAPIERGVRPCPRCTMPHDRISATCVQRSLRQRAANRQAECQMQCGGRLVRCFGCRCGRRSPSAG